MKTLLIIVAIFLAIPFWYIESRNIYHVGGKNITVWKTVGNACYIMPCAYFDIFAPNNDYVEIMNTNMDVVIAWDKEASDTIMVYSYDKRININSRKVKFILVSQEDLEEKIYEKKENGLKSKLKKNIELVSVHAFESWANDKNGVVL
ncbi:hypothetical protein H8B15_07245 [Hymenobacter sp. BT507]|uniref:Uncharacterized protein n=1 Tax=Hymenobacter citatus TaxID=2763506 RepID=A0ABR7MHY5_9BACT|nr:hypothetical protein [Hymenobacter citatus]MBC6610712.1 hypothetical protein [Hymenobacter citatus]